MEKHKCKLCFKKFSNGRALGGHMRSHMMNLPLPPKPEEQYSSRTIQLSFEAESSSSSSDDDEKALSYILRENPKRSIRHVDPEFSFPVTDTHSVILHDRESESETDSSKSKTNPSRRRSKRHKLCLFDHKNNTESVSSVSDAATTEEDVAFCLMMMSRDKWQKKEEQSEDEEEEEDSDEYDEEPLKSSKNNRVRGKFKCETCDKVFRSYQALGGHRASHKKMKVVTELKRVNDTCVVEKKIHECPVCLRVFASGQALGGHKRTHVTGSSATISIVPSKVGNGNSFIDLNLPAPVDDDDAASQIDNSALSDSGFR